MSDGQDAPANFDERLRQRQESATANTATPSPLNLATIKPGGPGDNIPNTLLAVAAISFALGSLFMFGAAIFLAGGIETYWWSTYQLGFFVAAWAAYHWGEFAVTAGWNLPKCSVDSFLLDNGAMYHIANGTALLEYLVTLYFKPSLKSYPYVSTLGIFMVIAGQALRSDAMMEAGTNFSHQMVMQKATGHRLVTDGIYRWFRHPSYTGFYYWALGTQLVLQNPLTFVMFCALLWRFFYYRTRTEEKALVRFFGQEYEDYRRRTRTWIPFVP